MREIVQFQIVGDRDDTLEKMEVVALDSDGYLWIGYVDLETDTPLHANWKSVQGPDDMGVEGVPLSRLDALEKKMVEAAAEREAIERRLDSLPVSGKRTIEDTE